MRLTTLCYIEHDGCYLMLNRNKKANDENAGKWIGVGGHLEENESPEECVLREIKEETGMTVTRLRFNRTKFFAPSNTLMVNFTAFVSDAPALHTNEEIDRWSWFTPEQARENIRPGSLAQEFLNAYLDEWGIS